MENSIYTNTATSNNTELALSNAANTFRKQENLKLRDLQILNYMKSKRNDARIARIKAQYRATVVNMQAAYNNAYGS